MRHGSRRDDPPRLEKSTTAHSTASDAFLLTTVKLPATAHLAARAAATSAEQRIDRHDQISHVVNPGRPLVDTVSLGCDLHQCSANGL